MSGPVKILLVGGTSHVGKSTIAAQVAAALGWNTLSTDQLARHPGRPWRDDGQSLPDDVIAYYSKRSTTERLESVLEHYERNVWPIVEAIVRSHLNNPYDPGLVFEGSAILPDLVAAADFERASSVWLTAPDAVITERIASTSRLYERSDGERALIDAFAERAIAFGRMVTGSVDGLGLQSVDATSPDIAKTLRALAGG